MHKGIRQPRRGGEWWYGTVGPWIEAVLNFCAFKPRGGVRWQSLTFWEKTGAGALVVIFVVALAVAASRHNAAEQARLDWLRREIRLYSPDDAVLVNGRRVADPGRWIAVLGQIRPSTPHHSHPVDFATVELRATTASLRLAVGRDSQAPDEFWVFADPGNVEIGRITAAGFEFK